MRTQILIGTATLLLLAGCSGGTPDPSGDDGDAGGGAAETPCIVGTWQLDVPDYAAQSEAFVLGLGLPIVGFAMDGSGTITFTEDGLVATEVALETSGTIVAGETSVPFVQPSVYTGSGDWSQGSTPDTIDLENWANLPDASSPVDPTAPEAPAIDYTDIPTVTVACTADSLSLQAPGAPLTANWVR